MKVTEIWKYKLKTAQGALKIHSVIYTLDGSKVVVAAGSELLVYDAMDGTAIKSIKAHNEPILCLAPLLRDGFASGGQDKQVMIWSSSFEGTFKYSHNDCILSICQNPINGVVLTCTESDFGLWAHDMKAVPKTKIHSKIVCSSWSSDGKVFALGLQNGQVSIRSPTGIETAKIERVSKPVRSISWSPATDSDSGILVIADPQNIAYHKASGERVGKDLVLNYEPFVVSHFKSGQYMIMGGANNEAQVWTAEGIELGRICSADGNILSCGTSSNGNQVVIGSDGKVAVYQIDFVAIFELSNDQFAIRNNMVDVLIHNLGTNRKTRLKCREYIKNIALHRDILAIQLPSKTVIYEKFCDNDGKNSWKVKEKIQESINCDRLLTSSFSLFFATKDKLEMLSFSGKLMQEWKFEDEICFAKVFESEGKDTVVVCLNNGQVFELFADIANPNLIVQHMLPVISADINSVGTKLAMIDEENTCSIYDFASKKILYQELYVTSAVWNDKIENAVCISGVEGLTLKVGNTTSFQCRLTGYAVGFKGLKVFCLNGNNLETVEIPLNSFPGYESADAKDKETLKNAKEDKSLSKEKYLPKSEVPNKITLETETFEAAAAFEKIGKLMEAVELLGKGGHMQKLTELARRLNLDNQKALFKCVEYLKRFGNTTDVLEILQRIGDVSLLLAFYVDRQEWQTVFKIGRENPELNDGIFLTYGNFLMSNDRFEEAQEYYIKAGKPEEATNVLKFLANGSITQERYELAAYYYWNLSKSIKTNDTEQFGQTQRSPEAIRTWNNYTTLAELYYCYFYVHQYISDPFTFSSPFKLMNASKIVLQKIQRFDYVLPGISEVYLYYCLAKVSSQVGCTKLSQQSYDKLQSLNLPAKWQNTIDLATMLIKSSSPKDSPEYTQECAQCKFVNPVIGSSECSNCYEPFVYSFYSFEPLPIVRFVPEMGLSEEDVLELLKSESPEDISVKDFSKQVFGQTRKSNMYSPIIFNRQQLLDCDPRRVFTKDWHSKLPPKEYYFLNSTEIYPILCSSCNHFFAEEEWNYQVLMEGNCSFCKRKSEISRG